MRSNPTLKKLYKEYNRRFFAGKLPDICVRFGDAKAMKAAGVPKGTCAVTLLNGSKPYAIVIREYQHKGWGYIKSDLLHEMVHVARPRANHGKVFQNEMKRLAAANAFVGIW